MLDRVNEWSIHFDVYRFFGFLEARREFHHYDGGGSGSFGPFFVHSDERFVKDV